MPSISCFRTCKAQLCMDLKRAVLFEGIDGINAKQIGQDESGGFAFEKLQREQDAVDADADFEFAAQCFNGVAKSAE
jgi:hypothetical protein